MSSRLRLAALLFPALALMATLAWLHRWWHSPLALDESGLVLQVDSGDSLSRLAYRLAEDRVLQLPRLFSLLGRFSGADQRIRQGEFRVASGTSPAELLDLLQYGDTIRYLVTLPEGIRLGTAIELLQSSEGVSPILADANDPRLRALVAPAISTEGFFLPETYQYERGDTDLAILREAHRLMRELLDAAWQQRSEPLPYETPYEVLTMASIIEKETGMASERATIGGVFVRRLQRNMRLQTDPTVIYGLGSAFSGNLTRAHLRDAGNRYNTYRHHGLPPGPIAMPGRAAIMAAVQPEEGEALYFVARGDGSHEFSRTLEEHEEAVKRFQLRRRDDYRSTPVSQR